MLKRLIYGLMFGVFLIFSGILFVGATGLSTDIEKEAELYRMDIHPITPDSGITTGHVIAYGHYIKSPYKVEIVNDTILYVNGVQMYPVLIPPALKEKKEKKKKEIHEWYIREGYPEFDKHWDPVEAKATRIVLDLAPKIGVHKAAEKSVEFLQKDPYVAKAWVSSGPEVEAYGVVIIRIKFSEKAGPWKGRSGYEIEIRTNAGKKKLPKRGKPLYKMTQEERYEYIKKRLLVKKRRIEESLMEDKILAFFYMEGSYYAYVSRGGGSISYRHFQYLIEIASNKELSIEEKRERLKEKTVLFETPELGMAILSNFDPSEYPSLEESKKMYFRWLNPKKRGEK